MPKSLTARPVGVEPGLSAIFELVRRSILNTLFPQFYTDFFRTGVLGAIVFFGAGSLAVAQLQKSELPTTASKPDPSRAVDAEPTSTLANFGDWVLRCQRLGKGADTQRVSLPTMSFRAGVFPEQLVQIRAQALEFFPAARRRVLFCRERHRRTGRAGCEFGIYLKA
jgi:hypothetical protein